MPEKKVCWCLNERTIQKSSAPNYFVSSGKRCASSQWLLKESSPYHLAPSCNAARNSCKNCETSTPSGSQSNPPKANRNPGPKIFRTSKPNRLVRGKFFLI